MTATCSTHKEIVAVDTCDRCGRFVCGDCLSANIGKPLCVDCYERLPIEFRETTSTLAISVFIMSLFSPLPIIWVRLEWPSLSGPFAVFMLLLPLVLSAREWRLAAVGKRTHATGKLARTAFIVSSVMIGIALLGYLWVFQRYQLER